MCYVIVIYNTVHMYLLDFCLLLINARIQLKNSSINCVQTYVHYIISFAYIQDKLARYTTINTMHMYVYIYI